MCIYVRDGKRQRRSLGVQKKRCLLSCKRHQVHHLWTRVIILNCLFCFFTLDFFFGSQSKMLWSGCKGRLKLLNFLLWSQNQKVCWKQSMLTCIHASRCKYSDMKTGSTGAVCSWCEHLLFFCLFFVGYRIGVDEAGLGSCFYFSMSSTFICNVLYWVLRYITKVLKVI